MKRPRGLQLALGPIMYLGTSHCDVRHKLPPIEAVATATGGLQYVARQLTGIDVIWPLRHGFSTQFYNCDNSIFATIRFLSSIADRSLVCP